MASVSRRGVTGVISGGARRVALLSSLLLLLWGVRGLGQVTTASMRAEAELPGARQAGGAALPAAPAARAQRFLRGRSAGGTVSGAVALGAARVVHATAARLQLAIGGVSALSAPWTAVGPMQVASPVFGNVTGRVTSIAIDPTDASGNTVYLGTTGGGVWKSTNAAGDPGSVSFTPLTDTLPVFSANAGTAAIPSLSIGAISVQAEVGGGVILAGTGDPNDALDSYYGSGILRSVDGGVSWTLIQTATNGSAGQHTFAGLSFAGFAWSTATPNLAVAAVSQALEGDLVNASNASYSEKGLYYSTDAGVTWRMATILDGSQVVQTPLPGSSGGGGVAATSVVWNPIRQRFYAAIRYHGYYQSPDGATWTRLAAQPGPSLSAANCPTNSGSVGSVHCPIYRGSLAVQTATGDTFALTVDSADIDQGLWQDVCGLSGGSCSASAVSFGTRLNSSTLEVGGGSTVIAEGDYSLTLGAVPTATGADTLLFVGTTDLYRCSLAGGCVLRNTTNATNGCAAPARVAPAQHALALMTQGPQTLVYLGNDGGLWRSTDGVGEVGAACSATDASHFQNLNGGLGSLAEVESFAQDPTDPGVVLVGMGATGTAATTAASTSASWPQMSAGEGGTVAIDQTDPALWYISTAAGVSLHQCSSGSACTAASFAGVPTVGPTQTASDAAEYDAPWILDPAMTSNVLIGTCRAWRGPAGNGSGWSTSNAISAMIGGVQTSSCTGANSAVRSLAAGGPLASGGAAQNDGSSVLYAGMAGSFDGGGSLGGQVFSTSNANLATGSTAWTDIASGTVTNDTANQGVFNPGRFDISSVWADSHDATGQTIYATVMGFAGNGIGAPHVYRSVDRGSHWLNISSNLPDVPASSVVVDPNDANTLYVAMDTGIYVTTQVASCVSGDCWTVLGTGLPNAPVVGLAAAAQMPTGDGRVGELRAATYGRGIWQIPLLTAAFPAQPAMVLNPNPVVFTTQAVGTLSGAQTVTVTNTGIAALLVSGVSATGDFHATTTCTGTAVAPGGTCAVQVRFEPTLTGTRVGTLTVFGNVSGGQATAQLTGNGAAAAAVVLNPVTVNFGPTAIGATSPAQSVTISNTGGVPSSIAAITVTGDFKIVANTCGSSLNAASGCTVSIGFLPTASGARSGVLSVADDLGTQTAVLGGTGTSPATDGLTPASLQFGPQQLNTTSAPQQITLSNVGDIALVLIQARVISGDFSVVNSCGNSLAAHSSCSMSVAYQPKALGPETGVLSVSDEYRSQTVTLSGTGVAPAGVSLSPTGALSFAPLGVGMNSTPQTVTVTNNGGSPLTVQSFSVTGDFAFVSGGTCGGSGTTLPAGSACTLQVVFSPVAGGPRSGVLSVADTAPNSPQAIQLSGTGVDFTLTADGSTSVSVPSGKSAVFPLLLSSAAGVPGVATLTCTGMPANASCYLSPATTIALGATTTVAATVSTGIVPSTTAAMGRGLGRQGGGGGGSLGWMAVLLSGGVYGVRRSCRELPRLLACALLCGVIFAIGCGATRKIPVVESVDAGTGSATVTPSGTYLVTVSATSAGLVRTMQVTLIVQ